LIFEIICVVRVGVRVSVSEREASRSGEASRREVQRKRDRQAVGSGEEAFSECTDFF